MTDTETMPRRTGPDGGRRPLVDPAVADELLAKADAEGVELLGPDGLLSQVTKAVLERALGEELTAHLGYEKHDPAGRGSGNSRNGSTPKTLLTDVGAVDLEVPRDRAGSFDPKIVRKGQTRLDGFNDRIIALYARGLTTRDIQAHLREMYQVEVSPDLISRVTDAVLDELQAMAGPAVGRGVPGGVHRRADGEDPGRGGRQPAGVPGDRHRLRRRETGAGHVDRPVHRGVGEVLAVGAVGAEIPRRAGRVHRVLRRADRPARRDRRGLAAGHRAAVRGAPDPGVAAVRRRRRTGPPLTQSLRPIYTAVDEQAAAAELEVFAEKWTARYPAIVRLWRAHWAEFVPFLAFPPEVRRVIYTTNLIESMNARLRKVTRNRGQFPTEQSVLKVLYLAVRNLEDYRRPNVGIRSSGWKQALQAFTIYFEGRLPAS